MNRKLHLIPTKCQMNDLGDYMSKMDNYFHYKFESTMCELIGETGTPNGSQIFSVLHELIKRLNANSSDRTSIDTTYFKVGFDDNDYIEFALYFSSTRVGISKIAAAQEDHNKWICTFSFRSQFIQRFLNFNEMYKNQVYHLNEHNGKWTIVQ